MKNEKELTGKHCITILFVFAKVFLPFIFQLLFFHISPKQKKYEKCSQQKLEKKSGKIVENNETLIDSTTTQRTKKHFIINTKANVELKIQRQLPKPFNFPFTIFLFLFGLELN